MLIGGYKISRAAASLLKVIPAMLKACWNLSQKTWVLVLGKPYNQFSFLISIMGIPRTCLSYQVLRPYTEVEYHPNVKANCLWSLRNIGLKLLF